MDSAGIAAIVIGLGATVAAMVFPHKYPNAPKWLIELCWWGGIALMIGGTLYLVWGSSLPKWLTPNSLIIFGVIGAALFLAAAGVGLIWQSRSSTAGVTAIAQIAASLMSGDGAKKPISVAVQNLKNLSNDDLRERVSNLANRMRTFQAGVSEGFTQIMIRYPRPKKMDIMEWQDTPEGKQQSAAWMTLATREMTEYLSQFYSEAVSLRQEIESRRGKFPPYSFDMRTIALDNPPGLAGPTPIANAAQYLEEQAQSLP